MIQNVINQLEDIKKAIETTLIVDDNMMVYFVDNNVLQNLDTAIMLLKKVVKE